MGGTGSELTTSREAYPGREVKEKSFLLQRFVWQLNIPETLKISDVLDNILFMHIISFFFFFSTSSPSILFVLVATATNISLGTRFLVIFRVPLGRTFIVWQTTRGIREWNSLDQGMVPLSVVAALLLCISLLVQLLCKQSTGHQAAVRRSRLGCAVHPLQTIMATWKTLQNRVHEVSRCNINLCLSLPLIRFISF